MTYLPTSPPPGWYRNAFKGGLLMRTKDWIGALSPFAAMASVLTLCYLFPWFLQLCLAAGSVMVALYFYKLSHMTEKQEQHLQSLTFANLAKAMAAEIERLSEDCDMALSMWLLRHRFPTQQLARISSPISQHGGKSGGKQKAILSPMFYDLAASLAVSSALGCALMLKSEQTPKPLIAAAWLMVFIGLGVAQVQRYFPLKIRMVIKVPPAGKVRMRLHSRPLAH